MYRSNWYQSCFTFNENFYIDISDYIDIKKDSLNAHKTEVDRRGEAWVNFVVHKNRNSGMEINTKYAEAFETVKWLDR